LVNFVEDALGHTVVHCAPRYSDDLGEPLGVGPPIAVRAPQVLVELPEDFISICVHSADLVDQRGGHVLPVDDLGKAVPF